MAKSGLLALVHISILIIYILGFLYDWNYVLIGHAGYGGKLKFLTFWNTCLQTIYFGLSVINDVIGSNLVHSDRKSTLQRIRDCFHSTIIFPTGAFVVLSFWAIYAVDRELIYPLELDKIIPSWVNHVQHTTVLPFLLIEKYLVYHEYPSKLKGITVILAFASTYLLWILWIAYVADLWVYPVLRVLNSSQKAIFIFFLFLLFISLYTIGEALTKFFWRKQSGLVKHSKNKSRMKQR